MKKSPNHKAVQSVAFCEMYWKLYEIDAQCEVTGLSLFQDERICWTNPGFLSLTKETRK